jgi:preprotein translocase subunit SecB
MNPSPLQLEQYFVTELHFSVNPTFDSTKSVELKQDHFVVEAASIRNEKSPDRWQVTLRIKHQLIAPVNTPYSFTVEIVGLFHINAAWPQDKERLVKTNGPSVLYGIGREIVRGLTLSGPYAGVLIPSVSFYESAPTEAAPASSQAVESKSETR